MGLKAIYRRPRTSPPGPGNKIYPYLLNGMKITHPNQVWCSDITYIPMAHGFMYLVVIMDWYSRYVLAWKLSNTLDADFCVEALEEALSKGKPDIFNTDQGSQFTGKAFTGFLKTCGIKISNTLAVSLDSTAASAMVLWKFDFTDFTFFDYFLPTLAYIPIESCGITVNQTEIRDIFCNHRARTDKCPFPDSDARQNCGIRSQRRPLLD
jgi:hypothetical protein